MPPPLFSGREAVSPGACGGRSRKVGCRRPTFLKFAKRRQIIWFFPTWQACIFRRSRTDECPTPRHENATPRTDNRVILKIGRAVFWMAANRNLRRAVMRSGVSQKVIIRITCRGLRRRRSSGSPRSTCRPPWAVVVLVEHSTPSEPVVRTVIVLLGPQPFGSPWPYRKSPMSGDGIVSSSSFPNVR